jgi:hypothetical protein
VISDSQITAVSSPNPAGTVPVTVMTPVGTSAVNAAGQFTYVVTTTSQSPIGAPEELSASSPPATLSGASSGTGIATQGPSTQAYYVDPSLSSQLVGSIVDILKSASSPDALEAQNMILRRVALQGDVVGSRLPPPKNISEIGGYINLLTGLKQPEMRAQMLAGILGVAGPAQPLGWISNNQPLAFVALPNDRPAGPAQAVIPLTFVVRSDFSGALQNAINALHQRGCALPISSPPVVMLPLATPGAQAPIDALPYLGRTLDLGAASALIDPNTDALALVRAQGSSDPFQVAAKVLAPGVVAVAPAGYDALQCNASSCSIISISAAQCVPVAPLLATAGFYPTSPLPQPISTGSTTWAHFTNITGLIPGVTKLGDELSLLYNWSTINHSVFVGALHRVWNGTAFA